LCHYSFYRMPIISSFESLRPQRLDRSAFLVQTPSPQFAGALQMLVRLLAPATRDGVLQRFQLHDYASESLRQGIVDVACHPISFFQNGCLPASLGKLIELNGQHRLMCERLCQFDFFRSIGRSVAVTNPDESFHTTAYQSWNSQKILRSARFQILAKIIGGVRIMFHIFARDGRSGKKQLAKSWILLPR